MGRNQCAVGSGRASWPRALGGAAVGVLAALTAVTLGNATAGAILLAFAFPILLQPAFLLLSSLLAIFAPAALLAGYTSRVIAGWSVPRGYLGIACALGSVALQVGFGRMSLQYSYDPPGRLPSGPLPIWDYTPYLRAGALAVSMVFGLIGDIWAFGRLRRRSSSEGQPNASVRPSS